MHIYFHPDLLRHDPRPIPGMGPARLEAVCAALRPIETVEWREADPIDPPMLKLIHTPDHIDNVLTPIAPGEERHFDGETFAMEYTAAAALRSAGLVAAATRAVMGGEIQKAFCLASPGGHHAEAETSAGFCFFNHVALAATLAQKKLGAAKVAVLDFDAHHGNGTQSLFWSDEARLLVSLHEDTGLSGFAGEQGAYGNILNIPLPNGSDGAVFRAALETQALPKLADFQPDLLLVSAGFDAHRADPLASLNLEVEDYEWIGKMIARFADDHCQGRVVAVLEGGYNLDYLGPSAAAFVTGLMHG